VRRRSPDIGDEGGLSQKAGREKTEGGQREERRKNPKRDEEIKLTVP